MNRTLSIIIVLLISAALTGSLMLTAVQIAAFDMDIYRNAYNNYNLYNTTQLTEKDYLDISRNILEYLSGKSEFIYNRIEVHGTQKSIFNSKELTHMEDVKTLFKTGYIIRNFSFILLILLIILIHVIYKGEKKYSGKVVFYSSITQLMLIIGLLILVNTDFFNYFTLFHEALFTNDLWLLDPKTDLLINMYPLEFFNTMAVRIFVYFAIQLVIAGAVGYYVYRKK